ncbi:MAG TPA: amidohydrolase family protein, partial [Anaerolineaceae bacterium]|nr:amidohydrolase family protein [Anaerolineaceae bacterium]
LHALTDERDRPELLLAAVRHFHQAGGAVALGNDYGTPGVPAGLPAGEMELLAQAGLSPMQILQAGTRQAAAACGQAGALGTIEPGKLADLIVVAGDPLADRGALAELTLVVLGGVIVRRPPRGE